MTEPTSEQIKRIKKKVFFIFFILSVPVIVFMTGLILMVVDVVSFNHADSLKLITFVLMFIMTLVAFLTFKDIKTSLVKYKGLQEVVQTREEKEKAI